MHSAARVLQNKAGRDVIVKWKWSQVWEACRDPQLWFCTINAFLSSVPNGYLSLPLLHLPHQFIPN